MTAFTPRAAKSRMRGVCSPMSELVRPTTLMTAVRFILGRVVALRQPRPRSAGGTNHTQYPNWVIRCAALRGAGRRSAPSLPPAAGSSSRRQATRLLSAPCVAFLQLVNRLDDLGQIHFVNFKSTPNAVE